MQFWIRNLFDPGSGMTNLDPGRTSRICSSAVTIPLYYIPIYSVLYTTASDAHNSSIIACFLIYSVPRFSNMKSLNQGVTERCRQSLLTNSALVYDSLYAGGMGLRGPSQWVQLWTWSPNKLRRSTSIFNLCFEHFSFVTQLLRPHIHSSIQVAWIGTITPHTLHPRILLTSLFNLSETLCSTLQHRMLITLLLLLPFLINSAGFLIWIVWTLFFRDTIFKWSCMSWYDSTAHTSSPDFSQCCGPGSTWFWASRNRIRIH